MNALTILTIQVLHPVVKIIFVQYRARGMRRQAFKIRNFTERAEVVQQAEAILRRCIELDPTDARAYNALGKHLQLERRFEEAGKMYDDGLAVTGM